MTVSAEITPAEVASQLESGAAVQILDVRAPHRLASGVIEHHDPALLHNVPNSVLFTQSSPRAVGLLPELPVVAVCGHGHSSLQTVAYLQQQGYEARSMVGGMAAWMQLLIPRELPSPAGFDRLVQFDRLGKGALSYLLVSGEEAFAIDVPRSVGVLETAAKESGARIVGVADTHTHADYLSGGAALAGRLGVPYFLHSADAISPYDGRPGRVEFAPLADGQELPVGNGALTVQHTPGHTEGSVCFLAGSDTAFTGDLVFIASIGRPDLAARTDAWSLQLYASLERVKQTWPKDVQIFPGHYGTASERNADRSIGRPLEELRRSNPGLAFADPTEFSEWIKAHVSTPPEQYRRIKQVNLGLEEVTVFEAEELEGGKNECALRSS